MPVTTEDRPIKIVREEVIDQLIMNYGHEKISLDAFEKRLDKAMATEDPVELVGLVEDLDLDVDKDYLTKKRRELSMNSDIPVESAHQGVDETDYMVHIFGGSQRSGIWNVASVSPNPKGLFGVKSNKTPRFETSTKGVSKNLR